MAVRNQQIRNEWQARKQTGETREAIAQRYHLSVWSIIKITSQPRHTFPETCEELGCTADAEVKGYCRLHYHQNYRRNLSADKKQEFQRRSRERTQVYLQTPKGEASKQRRKRGEQILRFLNTANITAIVQVFELPLTLANRLMGDRPLTWTRMKSYLTPKQFEQLRGWDFDRQSARQLERSLR